MLTHAQYVLIPNTPFAYPTHLGPLITLEDTIAHTNSHVLITYTEEVHIFLEMTGVKQSLMQQIFGIVKEAYLTDIHNHTTKSINYTVADILTHLQ